MELTNQDPLATVSVQSLPTTTTAQYRPIMVPVWFRHVPEREGVNKYFFTSISHHHHHYCYYYYYYSNYYYHY